MMEKGTATNIGKDASAVELTILMPCLNEAETLAACIEKAMGFLARSGIAGEVLIADNGSSDGSQDIATRLGARVIHVPEKGYGAALIAGIAAARGRYVIMGDSDDSYDFSALEPFIAKLRQGFDLVMGNRFKGGIAPGAMPPLHRYLGNPVLSTIGRIFFTSPIRDFHCGLRGFSRDAMMALELRAPGMEFASEMVVKATMRGLRIAEVPTTLSPDGRSRPPHLRSWRDGWRHLRFMLLFSPRWLLLYPGLVLLAATSVLFVRLIAGPLRLGGVSFDLNSLDIVGMGLLLGYQMVLLACFVRIFAYTRGFLPPNHILSRAFGFFTLEKGLIAGLLVVCAGLGLIGTTLYGWAMSGFGDLDPLANTRTVIAGRTLVSIGLQTLLFSLVFSYLGIDQKPAAPPSSARP